MRITVISTPIFKLPVQGYSGLEHLAWLTAKGLAEKGHEVTLVAPDGSECPGVTIFPVGPEKQVDEKIAYSRYWQHLLEVDCIVDHSWQKWCYILKQEGKLKAPVLGVLHAPVNTMYQSLPPGVEKPCFVCISEDQVSHFQALFGRPARAAYNGVDHEFYRPLDIPRSDRFLFLARFSAIKGADLAIQACKEAGVGLDVVGDTTITGEPEYLKHCQSMADGKQIKIIGGVTRGETVWWYSQALALLHPNQRFREPFGLAPVEAQLCGCPVIAWNYGAMRETIQKNKTGFLVDSMDKFKDVIHLAKTTKLGHYNFDRNYCREWATQFSVKNMIDRYEVLIQEAVNTGGW